MNYEDRIVCFLDILGFKAHIAASVKGGNDVSTKIVELSKAFESIRTNLDLDNPKVRPNIEITQFSDSIVISFLADTESGVFDALYSIMLVQLNLVLHGYLCRGGIARGKLIHTEKSLFGPALVQAYLIESEAALYPRVILDLEIVNTGTAAHAEHHLPMQEQDSILSLLKRDADGMYYIDYITGAQSELDDPELDYPRYLSCLQKIISSGLNSTSPSVLIKYKWLREKLADHLAAKKEYTRALPVGHMLNNAYEFIPDL
jgi:hypothetical protein